MIQYKSPSNKTEERKLSGSPLNNNKERIVSSSSAINWSSSSSPVVSSTNSSNTNSFASSKSKVSLANNTNDISNIIDNHNNLINQSMEGNESGVVVNGNGEYPVSYELEPITNDLVIDKTFTPICLGNDLWVSNSFHTIQSFKFCFLVYSSKGGNVRHIKLGDLFPGRGFFACCGYHVDEPEQMKLFFSNEQFSKVTSIFLKYYLGKDWSPTSKLKSQVNYVSIISY